MLKIALLLWVAAATVTVLCAVPGSAAAADKNKQHRDEDGAVDGNSNDIGGGGRPEAADDGQRFAARYAAGDEPSAAATEPAAAVQMVKPPSKQSSKQHNAKLLNRLGMKRVRTSGGVGGVGGGGGNGANHHRKRLASQSRSKYAAGGADGKGASDSQMFIVKLPPHAHFYDDGSVHHQRLQQQQMQMQSPYKSVNTVPVGFVSNGKPAKVYHWNLPTIKHALQGSRYKGDTGKHQMHHQQQHKQPGDFELPSAAAGAKIVPRRTLYYKPRAAGKPVKKSFVNNGKPNGFYVVSSKNAAAVPQYHKIVKAYYDD